jgi:serine/threonine-protein kinase ULK/ATG1
MAPEILRYEKYDAKADLWSIGAVLFEMAAGRPPFRASNHVELLRKIEKGEDRIHFPDESRPTLPTDSTEPSPPPIPVSLDIKNLIRGLLKRQPVQRMGFNDFFACGVWDGFMAESIGGSTSSLDVSTDDNSTGNLKGSLVADMGEAAGQIRRALPSYATQQPPFGRASNHQPAIVRLSTDDRPKHIGSVPPAVTMPSTRRSEPRYYVGDSVKVDSTPSPPSASIVPSVSRAGPRPILTSAHRRLSGKEASSIEDAPPITPTSHNAPQAVMARSGRGVSEGSPLAATPPITVNSADQDDSALESSDAALGREYVVVEKRTVEINALADGESSCIPRLTEELAQASLRPTTLARRSSRHTNAITRPGAMFTPTETPTPPQIVPQTQAVVPASYSPPFALSSTPPFAIPQMLRQASMPNQTRPASVPQSLSAFPPPPALGQPILRHGYAPATHQTSALARALKTTAIRLINSSANTAANAFASAAARRGSGGQRVLSGEAHPEEEALLQTLEGTAHKAVTLFELANNRLLTWQQTARLTYGTGTTPPFPTAVRRRSSASSGNSEILAHRQLEAAAGDAMVLCYKTLAFIGQAMDKITKFVDTCYKKGYNPSTELNDSEFNCADEFNADDIIVVQWFRGMFNDCFEKIEWAKTRCTFELPFIDKMLHDKAREVVRASSLVSDRRTISLTFGSESVYN